MRQDAGKKEEKAGQMMVLHGDEGLQLRQEIPQTPAWINVVSHRSSDYQAPTVVRLINGNYEEVTTTAVLCSFYSPSSFVCLLVCVVVHYRGI